jgi:hypothetical protein
MPSVMNVSPIENNITLLKYPDERCEYYHDSRLGSTRHCYSEGDLSNRRKLVWARDERGDTYIRCSSCWRIFQMTIAFNLIIGHHLYSVNCECCSPATVKGGCGGHTWVVLKNWVQRRLRGSIRFHPNICPACTSRNTVSGDYSGFRQCTACRVCWKLLT